MVLEGALSLLALAKEDGEGTTVGAYLPAPLQMATQETLFLLHAKFPTHFSFLTTLCVSLSELLLPGTTNSMTQNMPVSGGLKSKVSPTA